MRIITHDDGRCLTLRLVGELDHAAAQTVMPGIEDAVEEYLPRRCVLRPDGGELYGQLRDRGHPQDRPSPAADGRRAGALGRAGAGAAVLDVAGLTKIGPGA